MATTRASLHEGRLYVAGHRGLVGGAIARRARQMGIDVVGRTREELDLRDHSATLHFLREVRPTHIVLAAARVGGIMANLGRPVDFLEDNLRIQLSVISGAFATNVPRLLFLGSTCAYPRLAQQPIREDSLLTGKLELTNAAYAVAKIAGISQIEAYRRQFGVRYVSAMPTNVYGQGDNFDSASSHVLPALIRRFHDAKIRGTRNLELWGTGTARREFIHADDLARACLRILESYDEDGPINIGTGTELTISGLANLVASTVGYGGRFDFDHDKPDGAPQRLLDSSRIRALGWRPTIDLPDGIRATYDWWLSAKS